MWLGGEGQFFNKHFWTGDEGRNLRMCFWTGGCKLPPSSFGLGRLHVFAKRLWSECADFFLTFDKYFLVGCYKFSLSTLGLGARAAFSLSIFGLRGCGSFVKHCGGYCKLS